MNVNISDRAARSSRLGIKYICMCMCMCLCPCVCIGHCIYICRLICMYTCTRIFTWLCFNICVYSFVCAPVFVQVHASYTHMYKYTGAPVCEGIYMYMYFLHLCLYANVYVHRSAYIYVIIDLGTSGLVYLCS